MLNMTEDFNRLAGDIVVQKWVREDLLNELSQSVRERGSAVGVRLHDLAAARKEAARDMRDEMNAVREERDADTHLHLEKFRRQRDELRRKLATDAAAFMRDLTTSVAAYRDAFKLAHDQRADEFQKLSDALNGRLDAYRIDRCRARAAWRAGGHATQGSWLAASTKLKAARPHGGA